MLACGIFYLSPKVFLSTFRLLVYIVYSTRVILYVRRIVLYLYKYRKYTYFERSSFCLSTDVITSLALISVKI